MTPLSILFLIITATALLCLSRQWAPLPLLAGACYMTLGQGVEIGPFSFTFIRLLLLAGFIRVFIRRERPAGGMCGMDRLMIAWSAWALICSVFHKEPGATLTFHLGMVYNILGIYYLVRCFCQDEKDVIGIIKMTAILLAPVALEMLSEQLTHRNLFASLGGVSDVPEIRRGRVRSQGPFAHSIMAGTVGALCAPLMIAIWKKEGMVAKIGLGACLLMVGASASSGPLMSVIFAVFALICWRWRHLTGHMRVAAVIGYIILDLVMKVPAYYVIARIDVAGGSTGYFRAALIEASIKHLNEWWWAGTDYTRHWTPSGVPWSPDHCDITNYYIAHGVKGGLPLMLLYILVVWWGFRYVGALLRARVDAPTGNEFLIWALGASIFAQAISSISAAYFDQSILFVYFPMAVLASLRAITVEREEVAFGTDHIYPPAGVRSGAR